MTDHAGGTRGARHVAWLYRSQTEYQAGLAELARASEASNEPLLLAVAAGKLPPGLGPQQTRGLTVLDMTELGRNPARIIAAVQRFCEENRGQRVRYLGEMAWTGRSKAEARETWRHESLVNVAFAGSEIDLLCPYDAARLPAAVIAGARATHPLVANDGRTGASDDYLPSADYLAALDTPLSAPAGATVLEYSGDLRPVRALVSAMAQRAGLAAARCTDLVIAASEVAANSLRHAAGAGLLRLWWAGGELLCQFEDSGHITDPLAGHRIPPPGAAGGQGLWLVNQMCDLAEIRTSELGTVIRLHMSLSA